MKFVDGSKIRLMLVGIVLVGFAGVSVSRAASFKGLGDLPGGSFHSNASGVSADGSVVVGGSRCSALGWEAFRWTAGDGMVGLGDLSGGSFLSSARSVSADGSVVVGYGESASGAEAFRWTSASGMVGLGDLPGGGFDSVAHGVSADGSVVVGESNSVSGDEAFRWTEAAGMVGLGDLPGGGFDSVAYHASADGKVVVGQSWSASGHEAFRWIDLNGNGLVDPNEKLEYHPEFGLGDLPGRDFWSRARGVSADGSAVVGYSQTDWAGYYEAFIWDASTGMRNLKDVLQSDFGLDLTGWMLKEATAISDDGSTIVGYGNNPSGGYEAWIAVLTCDYALAGDLNDDCRVDFRDFAELGSDWQISYDMNDLAEMAADWLIDCDQTPGDPACVPKGP